MQKSTQQQKGPLANATNAAQWIDQLKAMDYDSARGEAIRVLQEFNAPRDAAGLDNINGLVTADEGLHSVAAETLSAYLRNAGAARDLTTKLANEMMTIYKEVGDAYFHFLFGHNAATDSSATSPNLQALMVIRALHAYSNLGKWLNFESQSVAKPTWERLHRLYRFAEEQSVAPKAITVNLWHRGISISPAATYAHSLLLTTLGNGAFSARQIQTADELLGYWCTTMVLDRSFDARKHFYYVALNEPTGAHKVHGNLAGRELRFISTDTLAEQVERTRNAFRQGQVTPSIGIDPKTRAGEYAEFLDKLRRLWSPERLGADQRNHARMAIQNENITVVRGLDAIGVAATEDYEAQQALEDPTGQFNRDVEYDLKTFGFVRDQTRAKLAAERQALGSKVIREDWRLLDESTNGFGVVFPEHMDQDLKVGTLLGLKRQKSSRWAVGYVVRKIAHKEGKEVFVGVEVLSHSPVIVNLLDDDSSSSVTSLTTSALRRTRALFLPGEQVQGRADTLLVDSAVYGPNKDFLLSARNVSYQVRLTRVVRRGTDWQRVAFEVIGKK